MIGDAVETLIVGAGPAGLATAACLGLEGRPYVILEKEDRIGSAWRRHYDRLRLHTTKDESHLPHLPFPDHCPRYVPRHQVVEYLDAYAAHFRIEPLFGQEVVRIRRADGLWVVSTAGGEELRAHAVVVATGFNRRPVEPEWPGMADFGNPIRHSHTYKDGRGLEGKAVLVIGMGNTGAEVALDLHESGAKTFLSVRGPVNIVPRDVLGRPTAKTALLLAKLPAAVGDRLGALLRRLTIGDLSRYGIDTPEIAPVTQLRRFGKTPVIDVGAVPLIKAGRIQVLPAVRAFAPGTVTFADGSTLPFDHVILATGYASAVDDFLEDASGLLDEQGHPRALMGEGPNEGLYFVGFDGYSPGGVLRTIRRDAPIVAERIAAGTSAVAS